MTTYLSSSPLEVLKSLPPFIHITKCTGAGTPSAFNFIKRQVRGKQENSLCSSCSLSWKQKDEHFSPYYGLLNPPPFALSITVVRNRGRMPAWQQWKKGFWSNPPSTQYCKRTSKLNKNCPHQRLPHWGENTAQDEWHSSSQAFVSDCVSLYILLYTTSSYLLG